MPEVGEGTRTVRGWVVPEGVDIPDQHWYKIDFGGNVQHDLDREGHLHLARQCGLIDSDTRITDTGSDDGVMYAVAQTTLAFADGTEWSAVGGADAASNQVREPEHVWSVAGTRSVKRAVKRALGIRSAGEGPSPVDQEASSVTENAPDGVDDPPSEWDEASEPDTDADMEW